MNLQENNYSYNELYSLGIHQIDNLDLNLDYLISKIYNIKNLNSTVHKSNRRGGYQSADNLHSNSFFYPLVDIIHKTSYKIFKNPNLKLQQMWANISSYGNWNSLHDHGSDNLNKLSGVIYLKVPQNSGSIYFHNPIDLNFFLPLTPKKNTLLLFPANIPHMVETNLSQEDRISIAFNFN